MDFLNPRKKRAHKIRLYVGYVLIALALIVGSTILFFEASGFDLNRKTGEIIQNGMVFVNAHPESASVYINGVQKATTDARLTIPAGDYTFEFMRQGYRTWKRKFQLIGSQIVRLNYIFLFPEKLNSSEIQSYKSTPTFATQSPDRKWLLIQQPNNFATFDVYDLGDRNEPLVTSFVLPANLMSQNTSNGKLELVEWSTDNRHLLVEHTFDGGNEFLLLDRTQPAESMNLNKYFSTPIYKVALRNKKPDSFHILDKEGGTLRFADAKSKQITDIAQKVFSFKSYGDDIIFYVSSENTEKDKVNVNIMRGRDVFKIRELVAGKKYPIDISRYDDEWYMAVGSDADNKAYVYNEVFKDLDAKPPLIPMPVAVFRMEQPLTNIAVSANTRFISVQAGSSFAVYDAEDDNTAYRYQYDTKLNFAIGQKATWMDGHRLSAIIDGKLRVWDYDGINMQTLVNASPGFLPYFDRDYDFLYSIAPSEKVEGQSSLNKTPMRTPSDL